MEATIKEIATILRSTDDMALQFIKRVESRIGQPVSHGEILTAMKKVPVKNLSLEKIVAKVQQARKQSSRRTSRRRTTTHIGQTADSPPPTGSTLSTRAVALESDSATPAATSEGVVARPPKTILERLDTVLERNWNRAENEGLRPLRMSAEDFIEAVYQYSDRREASRRRILQAAIELDGADVALTPALVADVTHRLFES